MKKSVNLMLEDEIAKLKTGLIEAMNNAALPLSIKKLVVESTARDISLALQNMINRERIEVEEQAESEGTEKENPKS